MRSVEEVGASLTIWVGVAAAAGVTVLGVLASVIDGLISAPQPQQ